MPTSPRECCNIIYFQNPKSPRLHPEFSVMANLQITKPAIEKSVKSLLKWLSSNSKSSSNKETLIYLILSTKLVPHRGRKFSVPLHLPHPIHSSFFIIFDDKPTSPLSLSSIQNTINPLALPGVSIHPFSEFRANKELFSDGAFLVDKNIIRRITPNRKRRLVEINFRKGNWVEDVKKYVYDTSLKFTGGTCIAIEVGRDDMQWEKIVENVEAAVQGATMNLPKKWKNVRGFYVKSSESVALPIYEFEDGGLKRKRDETDEVIKKSKV